MVYATSGEDLDTDKFMIAAHLLFKKDRPGSKHKRVYSLLSAARGANLKCEYHNYDQKGFSCHTYSIKTFPLPWLQHLPCCFCELPSATLIGFGLRDNSTADPRCIGWSVGDSSGGAAVGCPGHADFMWRNMPSKTRMLRISGVSFVRPASWSMMF
ncbi:hypothetical protein K439DRAFT_433740 [Ramaria rubella]|nr:hypothetical protein K439DRAFT_433740 [Ramaria rubella]